MNISKPINTTTVKGKFLLQKNWMNFKGNVLQDALMLGTSLTVFKK